jgi:hypothetical protein
VKKNRDNATIWAGIIDDAEGKKAGGNEYFLGGSMHTKFKDSVINSEVQV